MHGFGMRHGRLVLAAALGALVVPTAPALVQADTVSGPTVTFDSGPQDPAPTTTATPKFAFSSSDPQATFECALDAAPPESCASPHTTAPLADGPHQLQVRATDALGTPGPWASRSFTVDTSVPAVTFTAGPDGPTQDQRPVFRFASASGSTFECRLDGTIVACSGGSFRPAAVLPDGPHLFEARATNKAGTTGDWAARAFAVDTEPPETVLVTIPAGSTSDPTPVFAFIAPNEPVATFECNIDLSPFAPCSSPWTPGEVRLGRHHVEVRAGDAVGNIDDTPAMADFKVSETGTASLPTSIANIPFENGVRLMGADLAANLDRAVRALRTKETRAIVRRRGVTVAGVASLIPGTLTMTARAPTNGGSSALLRGTRKFDVKGSGTLVLQLTPAGRRMMRRFRSMPLLLSARFTSQGLSLTATSQVSLVRDWLTPAEARRAVAAAIRKRQGARPKRLTAKVVRRCGSGCLAVQAAWLYAGTLWSTSGRARQVDGELRAALKPPVAAPSP